MIVEDIIKAHNCCFRVDNLSCTDCPLFEIEERNKSCQKVLAELTIKKLISMRDLLDDKVNHHYYDTLEFYQEENIRLKDRLDEIRMFVDKHTEY